MFQRQVASTDLGTWLGPQSSTQGHTVLLSCRVPALKQGHSTARAGGAPGLSVLFGLASKASCGVRETEFPLRSCLLRFPMYQTKLVLLSWASTIVSRKTKKDLVSCRTVHGGRLRGETCLG